MLRDAWMSAITREPKTFNNWLGFERGFWNGASISASVNWYVLGNPLINFTYKNLQGVMNHDGIEIQINPQGSFPTFLLGVS